MFSVIASQHSGPLPHPDVLRAYNQAVPGTGDAIVRAFVEEGEHRRSMEERFVALDETSADRDHRRAMLGQWLAFGVLAAFVVVCGMAVWLGSFGWPLGVLGGVIIAGMVVSRATKVKELDPHQPIPGLPMVTGKKTGGSKAEKEEP